MHVKKLKLTDRMDKKDINAMMTSLSSSPPPYYSDDNSIEVEHNPVSLDDSDEYEFPVDDINQNSKMTQKVESVSATQDLESIGRKRYFSASGSESDSESIGVKRITPQVNCKEKIVSTH